MPNASAFDTTSLHLGHEIGLISHKIRMVVCALIFATRDALEVPEIELSGKALVLHSSEILLKNAGDEALLAVVFYCFTMGLKEGRRCMISIERILIARYAYETNIKS